MELGRKELALQLYIGVPLRKPMAMVMVHGWEGTTAHRRVIDAKQFSEL